MTKIKVTFLSHNAPNPDILDDVGSDIYRAKVKGQDDVLIEVFEDDDPIKRVSIDETTTKLVMREGQSITDVLADYVEMLLFPPEPTYAEKRAEEYPAVQEQLDMLYHDPEAWRATIAEIKARHPKG